MAAAASTAVDTNEGDGPTTAFLAAMRASRRLLRRGQGQGGGGKGGGGQRRVAAARVAQTRATRGPSWMGIESDYSHNNGIMGYVTHGRYL